ncbi:MAG: hypothetical protein K8E66_05980, partial [Phycisphaerales bacterium]|nr:hypothetical protein [Phycisphaerales bacterium]
MKPVQMASIALMAGVLASCAAYGQAPGYGPPPGSQPPYDDNRGYNDDRRQDDPRYGDQRYDDQRYEDRYSPRMDVGFFYEELSPYGDWVYTRDLGWAWFPRNVHSYWRPYTDGRWVMTEYGWTWVSYEPFGWATYHYGRWGWDSRFGWLWVPGTIWGPAWVSWQHGGGYVGWAPLPPSVGFEIGIGLRLGGFNLSIGIRPEGYSFVPEHRFLDSRVSGYMVPTARNVTIIHNTTNITNYTYVDNRVVNRGVDVARIEKATGRQLQRLRVADAREKTRTEVAAKEVRIYRPDKQRLDAVPVGKRANAGQRAEPAPVIQEKNRPSAERRDAPDVQVAPRAVRAPQPDVKKMERQEQSAKQELQRYQSQEKQKLEKLQAQEVAKARAEADRAKVQKNHQAEREALQQEQRDAAQ